MSVTPSISSPLLPASISLEIFSAWLTSVSNKILAVTLLFTTWAGPCDAWRNHLQQNLNIGNRIWNCVPIFCSFSTYAHRLQVLFNLKSATSSTSMKSFEAPILQFTLVLWSNLSWTIFSMNKTSQTICASVVVDCRLQRVHSHVFYCLDDG